MRLAPKPGALMRKTLYTKKYKFLCEQLRAARKEAGMTQQQVADRLKKHQSFVAKYEAGERRLDVVEFLEVVRWLEADPHEMIRNIADS